MKPMSFTLMLFAGTATYLHLRRRGAPAAPPAASDADEFAMAASPGIAGSFGGPRHWRRCDLKAGSVTVFARGAGNDCCRQPRSARVDPLLPFGRVKGSRTKSRSLDRRLPISQGAIAAARTMEARCFRSESWRRSARR